jgi:uncharacterized membrane protein (Fun14 family)
MAITVPIVTDFQPKGVQEAEKALEGLRDRAGRAFKAIAKGATIATGALAAGLGASVKAAAEDAKEQAKLRTSLKNTTGATDANVDAIEDQISAMTLASGVADTKLRSAMEILARATGDSDTAMSQLTLAMDIAAGTGKDLDQVSLALGKAYNGQFTALTKLGVPLDESITKSKDFTAAANALNDAFGGTQAALADTAVGRVERLQVAFGEASETLGTALLPILEKVVGFATTTLIPAFEKVTKVFDEEGLGGVLRLIGENIKKAIPVVLEAIGNVMKQLGEWIINTGLPLLRDKLVQLKDALTAWIKESGPEALQNLGRFLGDMVEWILTKGVPKLIEATAKLSVALLKWLIDIGPDLLKGLVLFAAEFTKGIIDTMVEAFKSLANRGLEIGKAFANAIIGFINNNAIDKLNDLLEFKVGPITINPPDIPRIPALADGGIVTGPTLALIGEAGPEAVVPLDRMGGTGNNITINVNGGDPNAVVAALRRYMQMNGSVPIRTSAA